MCIVPEQLALMFREEIYSHCRTPSEYISLVLDLLLPLKEHADLVQTGLVDFWLDLALREAETDRIHQLSESVEAIALLTELWLSFPNQIGRKASSIVFVMKRTLRSSNGRLLNISVVSQLFKLLDTFARVRDPNAPVIYRLLVFNLVESA